MNEIQIFYSKNKILFKMALSGLISAILLFNIILFNHVWESKPLMLIVPLFILVAELRELYLSIQKMKKYQQNEAQIIINSDFIRSKNPELCIDWNDIAKFSFHYFHHRTRDSHFKFVPKNMGMADWRLSVDLMIYDKHKLSQLFSQMIETQDKNQREILIKQFQQS